VLSGSLLYAKRCEQRRTAKRQTPTQAAHLWGGVTKVAFAAYMDQLPGRHAGHECAHLACPGRQRGAARGAEAGGAPAAEGVATMGGQRALLAAFNFWPTPPCMPAMH
jgi:hypothetical protein